MLINLSTYVAVTANISCLFALVKALMLALNSSLNTMMRQTFNVLCPAVENRAIKGPTRIVMVVVFKMRRTIMFARCSQVRWIKVPSLFLLEFGLVMGCMECSTRLIVLPATRLCSTNSIKSCSTCISILDSYIAS